MELENIRGEHHHNFGVDGGFLKTIKMLIKKKK